MYWGRSISGGISTSTASYLIISPHNTSLLVYGLDANTVMAELRLHSYRCTQYIQKRNIDFKLDSPASDISRYLGASVAFDLRLGLLIVTLLFRPDSNTQRTLLAVS